MRVWIDVQDMFDPVLPDDGEEEEEPRDQRHRCLDPEAPSQPRVQDRPSSIRIYGVPIQLSLIAKTGSQALLMMLVECDVVTLIEQRHSERSQRVTVMDDERTGLKAGYAQRWSCFGAEAQRPHCRPQTERHRRL